MDIWNRDLNMKLFACFRHWWKFIM